MTTIDYSNLSDIHRVAEQLLLLGKDFRIWAFYGEMGSGKTTLIRELAHQMGALHEANSPTFAIVNEYPTDKDFSVYHIDLYRIKNFEELLDIGFEEYLLSGNFVFIEWPNIAEPILSMYNYLKIQLELDENGNRKMHIFV